MRCALGRARQVPDAPSDRLSSATVRFAAAAGAAATLARNPSTNTLGDRDRPSTGSSSVGFSPVYRMGVQVHRIGRFKFKGSPEDVPMVQVRMPFPP